jgi:Holliday junction resolvase RusA-like endonuclease
MRRAWRNRPKLEVATQIVVFAVKQRPKILTRKVGTTARVWRTTTPDGDNVLKAVCDALQLAEVIKNDSVLSDKRVLSLYAAEGEPPCVEIQLSPIGDRLPMLFEVI